MRGGAIALAGVIGGAGQRDQREDHARRAGERQFPGVVDPQDVVRDQAAHRRLHALRKGAGPGEHGARPGARHRAAAGDLARHPPGGRPGRPRSATSPPPPPIELPLDWLERKLGRAIAAGRSARASWSAWRSAWPSRGPGVFSVTVPSLARHQGRLHQGRSGGRGRPHGRLRFDHAAGAAGARRRAARQSGAPASSTRCATSSWTRASPRSTTTRS